MKIHPARNPYLRRFIPALATVLVTLGPPAAQAANYTWDVLAGDGAVITPGDGIWDAAAPNWNSGTANVVWGGNNTAVFGGTDGSYAVTLGGSFTSSAVFLNFTNSGYTLAAPSPQALTSTYSSTTGTGAPATAATSVVWVEPGKTGSIGNNVAFNANGTSFGVKIGVAAGGVLNIGSGGKLDKAAGANRDLVLGGGGTLNVAGTLTRSVAADTAGLIIGQWSGDTTVLNVNDGGVVSTASTGVTNSNGAILLGNYAGSTGTLNVNQGGTVTSSSTADATHSVLRLAKDATATATVNLNGGELSVFKAVKGSGNGTFNFNGGTLAAISNSPAFLTGMTRANVRAGGVRVDTRGFDVTVGQALEHSDIPAANPNTGAPDPAVDGGLMKTGAGMLTLDGMSTYTGPTTVAGGTLVLSGSSSLNASSGIAVSGGARLLNLSGGTLVPPVTLIQGTVDGTGALTDLTVAAGSANVIQNGNGTAATLMMDSLTFGGAATANLTTDLTTPPLQVNNALNASAGAVTLNVASTEPWTAGTHPLISSYGTISGTSSNFSLGTISPPLSTRQNGAITVSGGSVNLVVSGAAPYWTGALDGNWTTATLASPKNWRTGSGAAATTDYIEGDTVRFGDEATGTTKVVISSADVSPTSVIVDASSRNYAISGNFGIAGSGSLTKTGTGVLTLASPNSYSGGTRVSAGILNVNHPSALGSGLLEISGFTDVTLDNTSGAPVVSTTQNPQRWSGDFQFGGSQNLDLGSGTVTMTESQTVTANGTATLKVGGIAGTGLGLTKIGPGTLETGGAGTYTGETRVNTGTLVVSGAINSANSPNVGDVVVAGASETATLTVAGGTVNATNTASPSLSVAGSFGAHGFLNLTGGTLATTSELHLGTGAGGFPHLRVGGGSLTAGSWLVVGFGGDSAVAEQTGGSVTVAANRMTIAAGTSTSKGVYNLSGGTFTDAGGIYVGEYGQGTLNLRGGTMTLGANGARLGHSAGGVGQLNLTGGNLTTAKVEKGAGTGRLAFNGGTLQATAATATFMTGLDRATVYGRGGTLHDGGFAVTVPQPLLAPAGLGVAAVAIDDAGAGYLDTPMVEITGGTGSGASAVATVADGKITSIVITSPGSGYTSGDVLTATVSGGGAGTPAVLGSVSLIAGGSGGVDKDGAGSLTLTGANTYNAITTVRAGSLVLGGTGSLAGAVNVHGSGAKFIQSSSVPQAGAVTVYDGAVDGTGTINQVVVESLATNTVTNGGGTTTSPLTIGNLTFKGAATLVPVSVSATPGINAGNITATAGPVVVNASKPAWTAGVHHLVAYTGTLTGFANFQKGTFANMSARQSSGATLTHPAGFIAVNVPNGDIVWTGAGGNAWNTTANHWTFNSAPTQFMATGESVVFDDSATAAGSDRVDISPADVSPISVTFANTIAKAYTISSTSGHGIAAGNLIKTGNGSVTLLGAHATTGTVSIGAGILQLGDGVTDGSVAAASIANNANLIYQPAGAQTYAGAITGTGAVIKRGAGSLALTSAVSTWSGGLDAQGGTVTVPNAGGVASTSTVAIASGATVAFTGGAVMNTVTGNGAILNNTGASVQFGGDHGGFSGTLTMSGGNTQINGLLSGSPAATYNHTGGELIFAGVTGGPADYTVKLGSLASVSTVRGANAGNSGAGTVTLETGHLGQSTTLSGAVSNGGGATSKVLALTKVGAGTLTLAGNKAYTGATRVTAGALNLGGNLASTSLTVAGGAHLAFTLDAAPANRTVAGTVTFETGSVVDLTAAAALPAGTHTVLTATGGLTGTPAAVNTQGFSGSLAVVGNTLVLTVTAGGYDAWKSTFGAGFDATNNGPAQDPDHDGIANLLEYVLNGHPLTESQAILPVLDASGADFVFTFHRRAESAADTTQVFQYGADPGGAWTDLAIPAASAGAVTITPNNPSAGIDEVRITVPKGTNTRLFGRLKASR